MYSMTLRSSGAPKLYDYDDLFREFGTNSNDHDRAPEIWSKSSVKRSLTQTSRRPKPLPRQQTQRTTRPERRTGISSGLLSSFTERSLSPLATQRFLELKTIAQHLRGEHTATADQEGSVEIVRPQSTSRHNPELTFAPAIYTKGTFARKQAVRASEVAALEQSLPMWVRQLSLSHPHIAREYVAFKAKEEEADDLGNREQTSPANSQSPSLTESQSPTPPVQSLLFTSSTLSSVPEEPHSTSPPNTSHTHIDTHTHTHAHTHTEAPTPPSYRDVSMNQELSYMTHMYPQEYQQQQQQQQQQQSQPPPESVEALVDEPVDFDLSPYVESVFLSSLPEPDQDAVYLAIRLSSYHAARTTQARHDSETTLGASSAHEPRTVVGGRRQWDSSAPVYAQHTVASKPATTHGTRYAVTRQQDWAESLNRNKSQRDSYNNSLNRTQIPSAFVSSSSLRAQSPPAHSFPSSPRICFPYNIDVVEQTQTRPLSRQRTQTLDQTQVIKPFNVIPAFTPDSTPLVYQSLSHTRTRPSLADTMSALPDGQKTDRSEVASLHRLRVNTWRHHQPGPSIASPLLATTPRTETVAASVKPVLTCMSEEALNRSGAVHGVLTRHQTWGSPRRHLLSPEELRPPQPHTRRQGGDTTASVPVSVSASESVLKGRGVLYPHVYSDFQPTYSSHLIDTTDQKPGPNTYRPQCDAIGNPNIADVMYGDVRFARVEEAYQEHLSDVASRETEGRNRHTVHNQDSERLAYRPNINNSSAWSTRGVAVKGRTDLAAGYSRDNFDDVNKEYSSFNNTQTKTILHGGGYSISATIKKEEKTQKKQPAQPNNTPLPGYMGSTSK